MLNKDASEIIYLIAHIWRYKSHFMYTNMETEKLMCDSVTKTCF